MAIVAMADAVPGAIASSAEYNKLIDNIEDLNTRLLVRESGHHARYYQSAAQSIPSAATTKVTFPNAVNTTSDVTVTGNNTFTLNRSGIWSISSTISFAAAAGSTFRTLQIANQLATARYGEASAITNGAGMNLNASTTRVFTAGSQVSIWAYQEAAGAVNTSPFSENIHVSLTWLRAA